MAREWMFNDPLKVDEFVPELYRYDVEKRGADPTKPPLLVAFTQSLTRWKATFVDETGDFSYTKEGNVAKSRAWLKKRLAERVEEEQVAVGG